MQINHTPRFIKNFTLGLIASSVGAFVALPSTAIAETLPSPEATLEADAENATEPMAQGLGEDINEGIEALGEDIEEGAEALNEDIEEGIEALDEDIEEGAEALDEDAEEGIEAADEDIEEGIEAADEDIEEGIEAADEDIEEGIDAADAEMTDETVEADAEMTEDAVEADAEMTDDAIEADAEMTDDAIEADAEMTEDAVEADAEMTDDTIVEGETEEAIDAEAADAGEEISTEEFTIAELTDSSASFTILAAALEAADLIEVLSGEGPYTVFAPTDEAFEALPEGAIEQLLMPENKDVLIQILTYHVVPGAVLSTDLETGSIATVEGSEVTVGIEDDDVTIDNANVILADVQASNGVIHIIDRVIVPTTPAADAEVESPEPIQ